MSVTTIQVTPATRQKLARLKSSSGETYDDLINKLLSLVPEGDEEGPYTHAFRLGLLQARLDVKERRGLTHEEVKRRLGLGRAPWSIRWTDQAVRDMSRIDPPLARRNLRKAETTALKPMRYFSRP